MHGSIYCPRCGYDLQGSIDSWDESCPLEGTCTECGLRFSWPEVILPQKYEPRWCVEFVTHRRGVVPACFKTFGRTLLPRSFWSRLIMSQRVRHHRLAVYVGFLCALLLLLYVPLQGSVALTVRADMLRQLAVEQSRIPQSLAQLRQALATMENPPPYWSDDPERAATWDAEKVQLQQMIAMLQQRLQQPWTLDHGPVEAVFEAVVFPLGSSTSGGFVDGAGVFRAPYVAPIQLWGSVNWRGYLDPEGLTVHAARLTGACIALVLFPITFILLPVSRKRAKVRWMHIWRVFVYSLALPVLIAWSVVLLLGLGAMLREGVVFGLAYLSMSVGLWVALILWWTAAIGRYLRIPHAFAVAFLMALLLSIVLSDLLFQVVEVFDL